MQWLLDSNRRYVCALHSQARYPYNEFVHSIPSYFSKRIITTIRLSGLSQNIRSFFCIRSQSHVGHSVLHANPFKGSTAFNSGYRNCHLHSVFNYPKYTPKHFLVSISIALQVQQLESYLLACDSHWLHYSYDLSRQRRRSVILVYIPHEITVKYNYLHRPLYLSVMKRL